MKPLLITPDNKIHEVMPKGEYWTLEEIYELLDCDTIDQVGLHDGRIMTLDDESKLKDGWEKNINIIATKEYKKGRMTSAEKDQYKKFLETQGIAITEITIPGDPDAIVGKVLISPLKYHDQG